VHSGVLVLGRSGRFREPSSPEKEAIRKCAREHPTCRSRPARKLLCCPLGLLLKTNSYRHQKSLPSRTLSSHRASRSNHVIVKTFRKVVLADGRPYTGDDEDVRTNVRTDDHMDILIDWSCDRTAGPDPIVLSYRELLIKQRPRCKLLCCLVRQPGPDAPLQWPEGCLVRQPGPDAPLQWPEGGREKS